MKYTKQIIFLLIINLIVVFISIFTGNLTRKIELTNNAIKLNIENEKESIKINKIEFSFYSNSNYLKKLHSIYFPTEENHPEKKIISLSNISNFKNERLTLVKIK